MPYLVVPDHIKKSHDIRSPAQILQNLDLALYLLLLNGLEDLDYALLVVDDVDAFEDLGIFSTACKRKPLACAS